MNKNTFYIIVIVGLLISNGILVFFFTKKGERNNPKRSPKEIIVKRLDFDGSQVGDYQILVQEHREKERQIIHGIHESRRALYDYLNFSDGGVKRDSIIRQIGIKQGKLEQLNFDHFLDIKKICREDQAERFEKLSYDLAKIFERKRPHRRPHRE